MTPTPATTTVLRIVTGAEARSAVRRLLWCAQQLGRIHRALRDNSSANRWCPFRSPTLNEGKGSSSDTSLPPYTTLLSPTPPPQLREPIDEKRKAIWHSPLSGKEKEDQWSDTETDADTDDDEEESTGDTEKLETHPPRRMKKRPLPIAREKPPVKRRTKRRPFSALLLSDEETESGDESDISSYTPRPRVKPSSYSFPLDRRRRWNKGW